MKPGTPKIRWCRSLGHLPGVKTDAYAVIGQDGGQSVRFGGKTLFFFSDTLLVNRGLRPQGAGSSLRQSSAAEAPETVFLANCAAVSEGEDFAAIVSNLRYFHAPNGLPREILTPTDRERFRNLRFWPEHGVWMDGKIYFYYLGVQTVDSSSIWGFQNLGVGMAALNPENGECSRFAYRNDWVFWRTTGIDLHMGVQVLQLEDVVYVFGSRRNDTEITAFLARVSAEHLTDPDCYEFLSSTEPSWSNDVDAACALGECAPEYSVSYNAFLEKYIMIYVHGERKRLTLRTADHPWGPYSDPIDLIGVPHRASSVLVYLGFEHAAFQQQSGRKIFVTYCEPDFSPATLMALTFDRSGGPAAHEAEYGVIP